MPEYSLSSRANSDLRKIYIFSLENFGRQQANDYLTEIHGNLLQIAQQPSLGKTIKINDKEFQRYRCASHAVFYRQKVNGIFVIRILHGRMDHTRQL